jgi:hypothetical protein
LQPTPAIQRQEVITINEKIDVRAEKLLHAVTLEVGFRRRAVLGVKHFFGYKLVAQSFLKLEH